MSENASDMQWFVIKARPGLENQAKRSLEKRIAESIHSDNFGQVLVPSEMVVEMRGGQKRKSERKFFPGYILVQMSMDEDLWHLVREVPNIQGFVGGVSDKPTPISDAEVDKILSRMQEGEDKPRPKTLFEVGEMVRVTDGPFSDFTGVVEEVNYEKNRSAPRESA